MHPAYSVIFFTAASGAGFGLLTWLGLCSLIGAPPIGGFGLGAFLLAFALIGGGLVSSTAHLRRPDRAWRAVTQISSSWLSREAVLALATLAVGGLYALISVTTGAAPIVLGLLTAALSAATVHTTAMIYAQLKSVRRWHTALTPLCYHGFALAGGALLLALVGGLAASREFSAGAAALSSLMLLLAWTAKLRWWRAGDAAPARSTPETATGLGRIGRVRLFEPPHTGSNYLLKEMGFVIGRRHAAKLRLIAFGLGGLAPIVLALLSQIAPFAPLWLGLAAASHAAGLLTERWLFFAEAEHAVMTYYTR